jgi:hypothetical protein
MIEDTPNKARKVFWGITLIGFLLPWFVIVSCQIYFGWAADIKHFPAHLFESGYNFFLVAVMNATPFAVVAVSARFLLKPGQERRIRRSRLAGLGIAAAFAMVLSLFCQIGVWSHIFNPKVHASLAGIGIFLLFWAALVILPVGYLLGWAAGKIATLNT